MNRRTLLYIGIGIVAMLIVTIVVVVFSQPPTYTTSFAGGKNVKAILSVDDKNIYAIQGFELVSIPRSDPYTAKILMPNVGSFSQSQARSQVFASAPLGNGQYTAQVVSTKDQSTTTLRNIVGIVWFSDLLYSRISQNVGLTYQEVVNQQGQVIFSGKPYDNISGFANKYLTYILGEGGHPRTTYVYDVAAKKDVKQLELSADDEIPVTYSNNLVYETNKQIKSLDSNLNEVNISGVGRIADLSVNENQNFVYSATITKKDSSARITIKKIDLTKGSSSTIKDFVLDKSSNISPQSSIDSSWYDEANQVLFMVNAGQIFQINTGGKS